MTAHLTKTLEDRLQKAKIRNYSLVSRVSIANQMIGLAIWYMAQLWTGEVEQLEEMDQ